MPYECAPARSNRLLAPTACCDICSEAKTMLSPRLVLVKPTMCSLPKSVPLINAKCLGQRQTSREDRAFVFFPRLDGCSKFGVQHKILRGENL